MLMSKDEWLNTILKKSNKDVKVILNSDSSFITEFSSNNEYGYITLHSDFIAPLDSYNSFYQFRRRELRAKVVVLKRLLEEHLSPNGNLPGVLVIHEYKESQVTNEIFSKYSGLTFNEKNLEPFVKIFRYNYDSIRYFRIYPHFAPNPSSNEVLKFEGERIIRFIHYDPSGLDKDIVLPIDSYKELIKFYEELVYEKFLLQSSIPKVPAPPAPPVPPAPPRITYKYWYVVLIALVIGIFLITIGQVFVAIISMIVYLFVALLVGQFVSELDESLKTKSFLISIIIGVIVISILGSISKGCTQSESIEWHGP